MSTHRSATKEQQIAADEAHLQGIIRGVVLSVEFHEREGDIAAAARLRAAVVVAESDQSKGGK